MPKSNVDLLASSHNPASCSKCGRPYATNANFCAHCGATIQLADVDSTERYRNLVVDGFRLDVPVGVGSMGVVYRATQLSLGKQVAVKILRQAFVADAVVAERFRREALAASRLKHPNTINVLHFGQTPDAAPYIAMEYLEGQDLSQMVTSEFPIGSRRIVNLMSQVCLALAEAHGQGIIHRDLKPANILVVRRRNDEIIKVLDFGIAKLQDTEGQGLTRDGLVCGTPAFMSPEQVSGTPVDGRSDIFSLGIILYFMMTGRLPFNGDTAVDMASSILLDQPKPPSRVRLGALVPPELEKVCLQALAKAPGDRFASADELRDALEYAYQQHESHGGDEKLAQRVVTKPKAADEEIMRSYDMATVVGLEALSGPSGQNMTLAAPAGRKRPSWLLPVVLGSIVGLGAVVGVVYALVGSGEQPAKDEPAAIVVTPEVLTASSASLMGSASAGAIHGQPPPATEVVEADDGASAVDFDAESNSAEEEAPEEKELDKYERRRLRKEQAQALVKDAKKVVKTDPKKAIKLLKKSLDLYGKDAKAWEMLGDAYLRTANRKAAAKAYEKVLKLNPSHPRRRILEKKIEAGK